MGSFDFGKMFEYKEIVASQKSEARIGVFKTPHGNIETPVFMPVGTVGAVKTLTPQDLEEVGAQIILGNTYHLYLRPGSKIIKKAGGLHGYAKNRLPILTDSGGFQVFSLGESRMSERKGDLKPAKITDAGVKFYSHIDGSEHFFSPRKSIEIQEDLGSDIIMAFDECPPASARESEVKRAVERTHRWLDQCILAKTRPDQALFPICQGGTSKELRELSANYINSKNLPGNAIGGVSVGESKEKIYQVVSWCNKILTKKKPRYLMGIGYPEDIAKVISLGVDMFDCVLPTRLARHGVIWTFSKKRSAKKLFGLSHRYEQINLKNAKFKNDLSPISESCKCKACRGGFSKSYLRHLLSENEPLGIHLLTCHNLKFVFDLIDVIKKEIKAGKF